MTNDRCCWSIDLVLDSFRSTYYMQLHDWEEAAAVQKNRRCQVAPIHNSLLKSCWKRLQPEKLQERILKHTKSFTSPRGLTSPRPSSVVTRLISLSWYSPLYHGHQPTWYRNPSLSVTSTTIARLAMVRFEWWPVWIAYDHTKSTNFGSIYPKGGHLAS